MADMKNRIKERGEDLTIKGTIKEIGNIPKKALAKANLLKTPPIQKERGEEKGKGKSDRNKGKGRGKGYPRHDKDSDPKEDKDKLTNNSQHIYLDPPEQQGDDETTVMFTLNMNKVVVRNPDKANDQENSDDQEEDRMEHEAQDEVKFEIVKTINQLPNDHYI
jgi:hypothetical protein